METFACTTAPIEVSRQLIHYPPMRIRSLLFFITTLASTTAQAQKSHWAVPDFAVAQYAGSIGYFSAGAGYDVFRSKARFSAHYGYVPENRGGRVNVISTKLFFKPMTLTVWNRVRMNPIDIGLMASYNDHNKSGSTGPEGERHKGYYWWNPALRTHFAMESSVTYEFKKGHTLRAITGYIEYNSNELYFINFVREINAIRVSDVVKVGTGFRVFFNEKKEIRRRSKE